MRAVLAVGAVAVLSFAGARDARAHGDLDQTLQFDPACLTGTLKSSASSTGTLRQEVVPAASALAAVDVCITATSSSILNMNIRMGTLATPGSVVANASTQVTSGTRWVHVELPAALATTPGATFLIELTGFPAYEWRGTCGQAGGACTGADPDLYPAGASSGAPVVGDFAFRTYSNLDADADGVENADDNCVSVANPEQENADKDLIELGTYGKAYDDATWPYHDDAGDACDIDDDNDGLVDDDETGLPGTACPSAGAATDPLARDDDGDMVLDGAECALGADPASAASLPLIPAVADDPDRDGLASSFETSIGTNPSMADSDGDTLLDGLEFKHYGTDPLDANTDGDDCGDATEIATINGDRSVTSIDLSQLAQAFAQGPSLPYIVHFDFNKDGRINSIDLSQVAQRFGPCP